MLRRSLASDTRAVSPVIGVILMVAITVVLAAVVFVLVQNLADVPQQPPRVVFKSDLDGATLQVIRVDFGPADWSDVVITGCDGPTLGPIQPGQTLTNCSGRVTVAFQPVQSLWFEGNFP